MERRLGTPGWQLRMTCSLQIHVLSLQHVAAVWGHVAWPHLMPGVEITSSTLQSATWDSLTATRTLANQRRAWGHVPRLHQSQLT